jgi:hypothetical protein
LPDGCVDKRLCRKWRLEPDGDVRAVQTALNFVIRSQGGPNPQLAVNGNTSTDSIAALSAAIRNFQTGQGITPANGRIDPNSLTFQTLDRLSEAPRDTALRFVPVARMWVAMALNGIKLVQAALPNPSSPILTPVVDALATHFKLNTITPLPFTGRQQLTAATLAPITQNFTNVDKTLAQAALVYRNATDQEARFPNSNRGTFVARAFTANAQRTQFSREFKFIGRFAEVAIIIHEAIHFVDAQATAANDIPEWDKPKYDLFMTAAQARHNPCAYAAMAAQLALGSDVRPGAGNVNSGGIEGQALPANPPGTPPGF